MQVGGLKNKNLFLQHLDNLLCNHPGFGLDFILWHLVYPKEASIEVVKLVCYYYFRIKVANYPLHHSGRAFYEAALNRYHSLCFPYQSPLAGVLCECSAQAYSHGFVWNKGVTDDIGSLS